MRTGTSGPTGTTSWEKSPVFNQQGFDEAMKGYSPGSQGTWVPDSYTYDNTENGGGQRTLNPGHWEGASGPSGPAPNRDDFTSYNWTQKTTLSPEQQAIFDATQQSQLGTANLLGDLTGQVQNSLQQPMDYSGIPGLQTGLGAQDFSGLDPGAYNDKYADAMYGQSTRYLDEQRKTDRQALESRLADQGFVPGTPGYSQAMDTFNQSGERAYADARDRATTGGFGVGSTAFQNALAGKSALFGQQAQSQQAQNQARTQAIAELLARRNQPLNELNAIRGGQQIGMPGGSGQSSTPNLQAPDLLGATNAQYQGQLGQYGADVSSSNATMGSIASIIAAIMMSDGRLKKDIKLKGKTAKGNNWYSWTWLWGGESEGVIAQEVQHIPGAVFVASNGLMVVDYGKV